MTMPPEQRIRALGAHLHRDVLMFNGKLRVETPRTSLKPLVPLLVLAAGVAVLGYSRRTRDSLLVKLAVLVLTRVLQVELRRRQLS